MPITQNTDLVTRLARSVARECGGPALIVARDPIPFLAAVRELRNEAEAVVLDHTRSMPSGKFRGVIIDNSDRDLPDAELLNAAWSRVRRGGRLFVCVPNPDTLAHKERGQLSEKQLRRLLSEFGRIERLIEQPFAWLVMAVRRDRKDRAPVPRARGERFQAIADLCRGNVLELGCGPGDLSACIRERGCSVVGVDLNEPKIANARTLHPDIEFHAADICVLRLERSFDTVVLAEVLEHVPPAVGDAMLETARIHLKPGGRLVVSVPNQNCIPHRNHVRMFDRSSLESLLEPFGRPRFVATQPFKWLLAYAETPA